MTCFQSFSSSEHLKMVHRKIKNQQIWCSQPLTPLMEGPDPNSQEQKTKKERSWDIIRSWIRTQMVKASATNFSSHGGNNNASKRPELKLFLSILGCPLAPLSLQDNPVELLSIKDEPIENSSAHYIIKQYIAATGCAKNKNTVKSLFATGTVKMVNFDSETSMEKTSRMGSIGGGVDQGCFVLWQMSSSMWSIEMEMAGNKITAGSDGKIVWRQTPWLGINAAKGPQRPLRRIIQGLDPKSTASMFAQAQCLGEKRIGDDDCFILKVSADRAAIVERSDSTAEVIRHVLYGYFSQKSGLLIYMEDSHLTRVQTPESDTVYWETTIRSIIEDYRDVDGILIAHGGRSVATIFRFGEVSMQHNKTRMEESWRIDDVVFNVKGLSMDHFIPPSDVFETCT